MLHIKNCEALTRCDPNPPGLLFFGMVLFFIVPPPFWKYTLIFCDVCSIVCSQLSTTSIIESNYYAKKSLILFYSYYPLL